MFSPLGPVATGKHGGEICYLPCICRVFNPGISPSLQANPKTTKHGKLLAKQIVLILCFLDLLTRS
jgi:hypothetical protein